MRFFATVQPATIVSKPPKPPHIALPASISTLDALILSELRASRVAPLTTIVQNYDENNGHVLDSPLPYESRPNDVRRVRFDGSDGIVVVAHAIQHGDAHNVALSTGFALNVAQGEDDDSRRSIILSCAHTLEEMRHSTLFSSLSSAQTDPNAPSVASGSFVITSAADKRTSSFHPVQSVFSSLHRSDLLLLSADLKAPLRGLPVSPYPAQPGTAVRAHVVVYTEPNEDGWKPWIGGTWSKWVRGNVMGYRDFAGREAQPGTYDALSHMLFKPLPTPGSSGGPVVDEENGAVVGVMLGTRMDSRVEGLRGWGVPSETIFEMFGLPGLKIAQ
ncbi:hypothetical protein BC835DRAFT_1407464 [Cytidiella melzeri]|nr:hypothetical protein BC835DRAFT_1407464 [Cytidiella melzeri]